jgi:hypothetical protein
MTTKEMTTKERLEIELKRLEIEENEIIKEANKTKLIVNIISLGKQALKNQEKMSFAQSMMRLK